MAAIITYKGSTLLDAGEGTYEFHAGRVFGQRDYEIIKMARAVGAIAKDLGSGPTQLSLTLFMPTADGSVATILSRIATFAAQATTGSLVIPDYGTYTHCLLVDSGHAAPQKRITKLTTPNADGYDLIFGLTFLKLRN